MERSKIIQTLLAAVCCFGILPVQKAQAKGDDFGIWSDVGIEKKFGEKWSIEAGAEWRTRNNSKTSDRWSWEIDGNYKITPWLKASAGYIFLDDNNPEKITYHANGNYNGWRPSYWSLRHRFNVSLTGDVDLGQFNFSLRERWQYTYRPEHTTDRYDFDNNAWGDKTVSGNGKSVLRSRFQAEYNIPHCKVDPYANIELFNSWSVTKVRYTVGMEWKITKQHVLGAYYRFQNVSDNDDDNEPDSHILGLSYKFKF